MRERFHARMVNACIRAHAQTTPLRPEQLHVAIIGAGATGVELAAELHRTTRELVAYGLDRVDADKDIQVSLIEAADRVLPALPQRLSQATAELLRKLGVAVHTQRARSPRCCRRRAARRRPHLPAELVVWAAGVKAPDFLKDIAGLETNRINQLVVRPTLQTTRDDDVFAHRRLRRLRRGPGNGQGRRRAAARAGRAPAGLAHGRRRSTGGWRGRPLQPYRYRDFGSLVSLGEYQHRRQHDGRPDRRQPDDRRRVRAR